MVLNPILLALCALAAAEAQGGKTTPPPAVPAVVGGSEAVKASPSAADPFDFDFAAQASLPSQEKLQLMPSMVMQKAVTKRRRMLKTHQILGLTTLGLMATTVILGQLNYSDLYGKNGGRTGNYLLPHRIGAYTTTGSFIATASFSLFAPTPYPRKAQGIDTSVIHKTAVGVASAGMVTQIVLGFITARQAEAGNPDHLAQWAKAHQAVGYTTLGALATAATVWIF